MFTNQTRLYLNWDKQIPQGGGKKKSEKVTFSLANLHWCFQDSGFYLWWKCLLSLMEVFQKSSWPHNLWRASQASPTWRYAHIPARSVGQWLSEAGIKPKSGGIREQAGLQRQPQRIPLCSCVFKCCFKCYVQETHRCLKPKLPGSEGSGGIAFWRILLMNGI